MWHFSKEFGLSQFPGALFRIRSLSADWRKDIERRMAVVEVRRGGAWLDFSTIREDDISALTPAGGGA